MYLVASVRPSPISRLNRLTYDRVQQRAKKSPYQSRVFVCVSSNRADAVDRLLMTNVFIIKVISSHFDPSTMGR